MNEQMTKKTEDNVVTRQIRCWNLKDKKVKENFKKKTVKRLSNKTVKTVKADEW